MYVLDQLSVAPNRRLWTLVDTTTNLPLLFPLLFLIDRLDTILRLRLVSLKHFFIILNQESLCCLHSDMQ